MSSFVYNNQIFNADVINECNRNSKYIEKYSKLQDNIPFLDYKSVPIAPEHIIQHQFIKPIEGPLLPNIGDKFRFQLPNFDILTGLFLVVTLTSTSNNTTNTSNNTGAILWNSINFLQYGKSLLNYPPTYSICRNNESPHIEEEEFFETIILGQPLNNNTQTYFLPLYGPMFDNCNNYLLLEFFRNLELEAIWAGLPLSNVTACQVSLGCITMHTNLEYKNCILENLNKPNYTLPWYGVRTFTAPIVHSTGQTQAIIDLGYQMLTAKNIYVYILNTTTGVETSILGIKLRVNGQDVFNQEDQITNAIKKYYSPDRKVYWGWNLNSRRIPFGLLLERVGFTGGACLVPGPYQLTINFNVASTNSTLFCHVEYYSELEVNTKDGILNTTSCY